MILLLSALLVFACSSPANDVESAKQAPPPGSLSFFDTVSGTYKISSEDKKLINTWQLFKTALLTPDSAILKSLFSDSIYCLVCQPTDEGPGLIGADEFHQRYTKKMFFSELLSLMADNSNVRVSYRKDGQYPHFKRADIFVLFPLKKGQYEASSAILIFDETVSGYKFSGYWTIP